MSNLLEPEFWLTMWSKLIEPSFWLTVWSKLIDLLPLSALDFG